MGQVCEMLDIRRKRLLFRSVRRGTKESDLVIGGFAMTHLESMDEAQLAHFEALLECSDPEILGWVIGQEQIPEDFDTDVMAMLMAYKYAK